MTITNIINHWVRSLAYQNRTIQAFNSLTKTTLFTNRIIGVAHFVWRSSLQFVYITAAKWVNSCEQVYSLEFTTIRAITMMTHICEIKNRKKKVEMWKDQNRHQKKNSLRLRECINVFFFSIRVCMLEIRVLVYIPTFWTN